MGKVKCADCAQLEKRIAELEKTIKEMQAQPREYHYHAAPVPLYVPPTPIPSLPSYPYIGDPVPVTPTVPMPNTTWPWFTCSNH